MRCFIRGNFNEFPARNPGADVVLFSSNRGRTVRLSCSNGCPRLQVYQSASGTSTRVAALKRIILALSSFHVEGAHVREPISWAAAA